jgi:threonine/homoserine/homoserine lactone efflux protein
MPTVQTVLLFSAAALALTLAPGPAVLYIVARSLHQGRRAGLVSTLGLSCGGLIQVFASVLGLSAVFASSPTAFSIVKLAGAGYLVFLGVRTIAAKPTEGSDTTPEVRGYRRIFLDGVVINALNPKAAIFLLAFLPQFVSADRGPATPQLLVLGLVYVVLALSTDSLYAVAAGSARKLFAGNPALRNRSRFVVGAIYLGLGVVAASIGRAS